MPKELLAYPLKRLKAARTGNSGPWRPEWTNAFPIVLYSTVEKRKVTMTVSSYQGHSIGAVHWYGEATERDDLFFLPKEFDDPYPPSEPKKDRWYGASLPDGSGRGRRWKLSVMERIEAERFLVGIRRFCMKAETHLVEAGFIGDEDEVLEDTTWDDPLVVFPIERRKDSWNLQRTEGDPTTSTTAVPADVGDWVKLSDAGHSQHPLAVKCAQDDHACIGRITQLHISEPDKDDWTERYWRQYYATIDTKGRP